MGSALSRSEGRTDDVSSPEQPGPASEGDPYALFRALGLVAYNWSMIELVSSLILIGLMGTEDGAVAQTVIAGLPLQVVWDDIEVIVES